MGKMRRLCLSDDDEGRYIDLTKPVGADGGIWKEGDPEQFEFCDPEAVCAELEERDTLWEEYVHLLDAEIKSLIGLAAIHGWSSTEGRITEGKRLRELLGIGPGKG